MSCEQDGRLLWVAASECVDLLFVLMDTSGKCTVWNTGCLSFGDKGLDLVLGEYKDNSANVVMVL